MQLEVGDNWDVSTTGQCVATLEGHSGWITNVDVFPDGQSIVSASRDTTFKVWEAATGACVATVEGHSNWAFCVSTFQDGRRIVSGHDIGEVKVWGIGGAKSASMSPSPPINSEPAGVRLPRFQPLMQGSRVRVVDDRQAVLDAFKAQDDVLGLPDDWEASLGCVFIVVNYDGEDSTYVLAKPDAFDEAKGNPAQTDVQWWPYSVVELLP